MGHFEVTSDIAEDLIDGISEDVFGGDKFEVSIIDLLNYNQDNIAYVV